MHRKKRLVLVYICIYSRICLERPQKTTGAQGGKLALEARFSLLLGKLKNQMRWVLYYYMIKVCSSKRNNMVIMFGI